MINVDKYPDKKCIDKFLEDLYVDDSVSGCLTIEEGKLFLKSLAQ